MSEPRNPYAFPALTGDDEYNGMTLRDWFAAHAISEGVNWCYANETGTYADAARIAYEIADAMLAERANRPSQ